MASTLLNACGHNRDWIERQPATVRAPVLRCLYFYQYLLERRRIDTLARYRDNEKMQGERYVCP